MVSSHHSMQQPYYRPAVLTVDTAHAQQKYYDEEDNGMLDDGLDHGSLDHSGLDSGLEMSPPTAGSRRDSFAVGPSLFTPKTEDWQSVDMQSVPSSNGGPEPHTGFIRMDQSQPAILGSHGGAWSLSNGSGSCTPLQQFDGLPAEYGPSTSIFHRQMHGQSCFAPPGVNIFSAVGSDGPSMSTSPQKDWMGHSQKMPGSPTIRSHNDMRKGDGIRKKNARFDIPAERNLSNIDNLIAQSTDEQEIKELKQQKRLLRNRQAALDSRQRKKMHTERLEDEKKQYTAVIGDMEEEIAELKTRMDLLLREKQGYQEYIETLNLDKEEMVRAHTIETGELRKKVGVLTECIQRLESAPMAGSAQESSSFAGGFDDMDHMTMNGGGWDHPGYLETFLAEPEVKQESSMPVAKPEGAFAPPEAEKSGTQGGLLFMLFLVGAFVLSSRSTPRLPPVSEDVRAASATLLENVLKDAGVGATPTNLGAVAPQPSGAAWASGPAASTSMLSQMGDSLTQSTQEQRNEQLFSLSAAQYNGVNSQDFLQNAPERSTSQGRRNLAEALAAMRDSNKQSSAEVYTRSLLWDQIPSEVVRNFANMVAECNKAQNQQQQCAGTRT